MESNNMFRNMADILHPPANTTAIVQLKGHYKVYVNKSPFTFCEFSCTLILYCT